LKISLKRIDQTCLEILSGLEQIKECLSYKSEIWVKGPFKKHKKIITKDFVYGKKEKFVYAGFENRISDFAKRRGIEFKVIGEREILAPVRNPELEGIEFRDIQLEAIELINKYGIGTINLAPGVGKTILLAGLLSTYNKEDQSLLFLCRSNDLVIQTSEVFNKFGFKNCCIGDGKKDITEKIVISTAQTWKSMPLLDLACEFNIVCCDEAHIGFSRTTKKGKIVPGEYEEILKQTLSPIRIALTGTLNTKIENSMLLEGLIGPPIIKADTSYGIKENILMKPEILFITYPQKKSDEDIRDYKGTYKRVVVENDTRHNAIAKAVNEELKQNHSCLIFCLKIAHIKNLSDIFSQNGIKHCCVYGDIKSDEREKIKKDLNEKRNLVVISSVVWSAALDLPELNCILDCGSGKSPEVLMQKLGRALRTTKGKSVAKLYIVLDRGKYLANHTIEKLITLKQNDLL